MHAAYPAFRSVRGSALFLSVQHFRGLFHHLAQQVAHAAQIGPVHAAQRHRHAVLYGDGQRRLTAAVTVNWPRAQLECRRLVAQDAPLDAAASRVEQLTCSAGVRAGAAW
ncbi:hypothetical protein [Streptomyces sp. NPDC004629]|uniref:hypothetical protein n=1 Tax=Streptomyces sp. NPDC004629 TaxID=3364705 RepID=UPI0036846C9B